MIVFVNGGDVQGIEGFVSVNVRVPVPTGPQFTMTWLVLAPELIIPPVMVHKYVCPGMFGVE